MKIRKSDIFLAVLSGTLTALSFPKFNLSFLAWISFIPLLFIIINKKPGQSFLLGLTAGISFNKFKEQLKIARKGGCSGFMAGRAVWQDVLKIKSIKKQKDWLNKKGVKNIKTLLRIMK